MSPTLQNPVFALTSTASHDGNGLAIILPQLTAAGSGTATGCMVLGINTQTNNVPGSVTVLPATSFWSFRTVFDGTTYSDSFIDSGTNGYAIPSTTSLPLCTGSGAITQFYCPTETQCLSATQKGKFGSSASKTVNFAVANSKDLLALGNFNFKNMAFENDTVDWGLPFFFGRVVYVGNDGQSATINGSTETGPFWAF
jgi:hypothetical protein